MNNEGQTYSKMPLVVDVRERAEKEANKEIGRVKEIARKTLWKWAHWKDGVQYVGSTGKLYIEALAELEKELKNE